MLYPPTQYALSILLSKSFLADQYSTSDMTYFFKQWGGFNKKKPGRLLDGRTWDDMPTIYEKIKLGSHGLPVTESLYD